jgi:Zn-dependent M32 family carboxypeptidase
MGSEEGVWSLIRDDLRGGSQAFWQRKFEKDFITDATEVVFTNQLTWRYKVESDMVEVEAIYVEDLPKVNVKFEDLKKLL